MCVAAQGGGARFWAWRCGCWPRGELGGRRWVDAWCSTPPPQPPNPSAEARSSRLKHPSVYNLASGLGEGRTPPVLQERGMGPPTQGRRADPHSRAALGTAVALTFGTCQCIFNIPRVRSLPPHRPGCLQDGSSGHGPPTSPPGSVLCWAVGMEKQGPRAAQSRTGPPKMSNQSQGPAGRRALRAVQDFADKFNLPIC